MSDIVNPHATGLLERLQSKAARVVVIGDASADVDVAALAAAGFDATRLRLRAGGDDAPGRGRPDVVAGASLPRTTDDPSVLDGADAVIVRPAMPQTKTRHPETAPLLEACEILARHHGRPTCVAFESTASVGTTRGLLAPVLAGHGATLGEDLFVVVAPTRIGPSESPWHLANTPRVVAGLTPACLAVGQALYGAIVARTVPVSSLEAAEMTKALEAEFRAVNVAMVNELARACHALGLDTTEVIDAAATKPFGFMPFEPGPGMTDTSVVPGTIGLTWKSRVLGANTKLFAVAEEVNQAMPAWIVSRSIDILNDQAKAVSAASILIVGVAYKEDVGVLSESPALELLREFRRLGAQVAYLDPHVPEVSLGNVHLRSEPTSVDASRFDLVVIATAHKAVDLQPLVSSARVIFDLRNATRRLTVPAGTRVIHL
jgi:UDP-N-acetyl-D-glucosamine dehydrogenase